VSSHSCAREHSGNKRLGQSSLSHRTVSADSAQPCRFPPPPGTCRHPSANPWRFKSSHPHRARRRRQSRSTCACFVVALLLARNLRRRRADVPALEAQKRTGGCEPDTCPGPADRTRRELLGAEPLMQIEIRHRCGRRADLHIVSLDAARGNGPSGLSRVEKGLALAWSHVVLCHDQEALSIDRGQTRIGSLGPGTAESFVAEGV